MEIPGADINVTASIQSIALFGISICHGKRRTFLIGCCS